MGDIYPVMDLSVLELITALKSKLSNGINTVNRDEILIYERQVQGVARLLRYQFNAKGINTLPSELLSLIFSFASRPAVQSASDTYPPLTWPEQRQMHLNAWIKATTHVCSHWRRVALAEPTLWTHLFLPASIHQEAYGRHFLQRAGPSMPLHVHQNLDSFAFEYRTRTVRQSPFFEKLKTRKVVSLHINGAWQLREHIWEMLADFDGSHLESLSLDLTSWNLYNIPSSLPPVFGGHTPVLKRVALKEIVSWPFTNLTHLWLGYQDEDTRLPMSAFLHLLSLSPALEYLGLVTAGPQIANEPLSPTTPRTPFPKLRILEMGQVDQPEYLLAHLDLPRECSVHIWAERLFSLEGEVPNLANATQNTAIVRVQRGVDTLTQHSDTLFIETGTSLQSALTRSRRLLTQITDFFLDNAPGDVLKSVLQYAPRVKRIRLGAVVNYLAIIRILETSENGAYLESIQVRPMSTATRLTRDERVWVKAIESRGSEEVKRKEGFPVCLLEIVDGVMQVAINPVQRRPLLDSTLL